MVFLWFIGKTFVFLGSTLAFYSEKLWYLFGKSGGVFLTHLPGDPEFDFRVSRSEVFDGCRQRKRVFSKDFLFWFQGRTLLKREEEIKHALKMSPFSVIFLAFLPLLVASQSKYPGEFLQH